MALSDWDRINNVSNQSLSQEQAFEGDKSLKMGTGAQIIKKATRDASPKEGSMRSQVYATGSAQAFFKFRTDGTGGPTASIGISWEFGNLKLLIDDGSTRDVKRQNVTLPPRGEWLDIEAIVWSSGGVLNARLIVNGSQLGDDFVSQINPSGGSLGLSNRGANPVYWDNTELFY